jgi:hypothetical protein
VPIYVYKCPQCGDVREIVKLSPMDLFHAETCDKGCTQTIGTDTIPQILDRVPTAAAFTIGGFNAKNGYSK